MSETAYALLLPIAPYLLGVTVALIAGALALVFILIVIIDRFTPSK